MAAKAVGEEKEAAAAAVRRQRAAATERANTTTFGSVGTSSSGIRTTSGIDVVGRMSRRCRPWAVVAEVGRVVACGRGAAMERGGGRAVDWSMKNYPNIIKIRAGGATHFSR